MNAFETMYKVFRVYSFNGENFYTARKIYSLLYVFFFKLQGNFRDVNVTGNASSTDGKSKMTSCTNCGPEPPPITVQNFTLWDESKKSTLESEPLTSMEISQIEEDPAKVQSIVSKRLFYKDAEQITSQANRTKRSAPRKTEVAVVPKKPSNPIMLTKFDGGKIEIIPLEIDASNSNLMTQAIMRDQAKESGPRLERVAHIVTNIVHAPRALSYGRVSYPYDSSLTSTRHPQSVGMPHNKLVIRPTRFRSQYRFPPDPAFHSGSPYSQEFYPEKPRKAKKLPAKLIDVHDNHDTQYEYVEMDYNHEGKLVPKKPPKYMRGRQKGPSYGYDYYKKLTRPHKKGSSKVYNPSYNEETDRGEGFDYQDSFDRKRNPDYERSAEDDVSQEDGEDRDSAEGYKGEEEPPVHKARKPSFVPSQPYPTGHYYQPPPESPTRPPHKFIPVPKTLEEYHQLHGTKFLNSYRPEEDDEYTFHYPNDNPDVGHYDEEESATSSPRPQSPPRPYKPPRSHLKRPRPAFDDSKPTFRELPKPEFQKSEFPSDFPKEYPRPVFPKPSHSGFEDTKTPTSFMSVTYGKPDLEIEAQTRHRVPSTGRKSKFSQPEPYESSASNDELSSKELQTFLDQVKSHVYNEDGGLKSELKTDLSSGLHSSHFDASIDPYSSSLGRKKAKKGYTSNVKDLLENARGNYNKKHNYRNKNSYSASGNSNSNYNRGNSHSSKKHGWKGDGNSGFGFKEANQQDAFDGDLFDKDGAPVGFKRDLFGKDRMSLLPSESRDLARGNGRGARRVKVRVTKKSQVLEENETSINPVVRDQRTTTESILNATATTTTANATSN